MTSFGGSGFTADLAAALKSPSLRGAGLTDEDLDFENDLLDDGLATGPATGPVLQRLMSAPVATQDDGDAEEPVDDAAFDDRKAELGSMHSTLTAKTQFVNKLMYEKGCLMDSFEVIGTPFEILGNKRAEIAAMPDGEDKEDSVKMYNTIAVLFAQCRQSPELRDFMSRMFKQTEDYYSLKTKRKAMDSDLQAMIELRDEQEMNNFRAKQKKRLDQELQESDARAGKKARH